MLKNQELKEIFKKYKVVSENNFSQLSQKARAENKKILEYLAGKKSVNSESTYKAIAKYFGLPFVDLSKQNIKPADLNDIKESVASSFNIIAFKRTAKEIYLATNDPTNKEIIEYIEKNSGLKVKLHIATLESIKKELKRYNLPKYNIETVGTKNSQSSDKIIDIIFEYTASQKIDKIIIVEDKEKTKIDFIKDQESVYSIILSQKQNKTFVKKIEKIIIAKNNEKLPIIDRYCTVKSYTYKINFLASVKIEGNVKEIILEIITGKNKILSLKQLGMQKDTLFKLNQALKHKQGLILLLGPQNSGKTTTIYSMLKYLNNSQINIATLESSVEEYIAEINQYAVNSVNGLNFLKAIQYITRQNPDVLMIEEIFDKEIGKQISQLSNSGILIFSTLDEKEIAKTIQSLKKLGFSSSDIKNNLKCLINQRLVKKLCPYCLEKCKATSAEINEIEKMIDSDKFIEKAKNQKLIPDKINDIEALTFYKSKGCPKCNQKGFKDVIGIFEIIDIEGNLKKIISSDGTLHKIKKELRQNNQINLIEDGIIKAQNGITSLAEVIKVCQN